MIVLLTGATGFIGSPLVARLKAEGHELRFLRRNHNDSASNSTLDWTSGGAISEATIQGLLSGVEAVIHLAGENIGAWPWSKARKQRILESRIFGTRALVQAMARMSVPPKVFIAASAVGIYGDSGSSPCLESARPGKGFLADVVVAWEQEIFKAEALGIRTVAIRNGVVLGPSSSGGAMKKMVPVFKLGLGARMGSGQQYMSWIHLEDTLGIFMHALQFPEVQGPVNACAPEAVMQKEFSHGLAKALRRPCLFWIPAFIMRLILGGMAATILEGQRALPDKILGLGYRFRYPKLAEALRSLR